MVCGWSFSSGLSVLTPEPAEGGREGREECLLGACNVLDTVGVDPTVNLVHPLSLRKSQSSGKKKMLE